ncbi:hypothetical protein D3C72_1248170 [compost metagenome]
MKNKGITLIALIVTIIVLIILAGISINILIGENGILTKAELAKEQSSLAENKENADLEKTNQLLNSYTTTRGSSEDVLALQQEVASLKTKIEQLNKIGETYTRTDTIAYTAKGSWVNRNDITYEIPAGTWVIDFYISNDATSGTGICTVNLAGLGFVDSYWKSSTDYNNVHFSAVKTYTQDTTGYLTYYQSIAANRSVYMTMNAVRIK